MNQEMVNTDIKQDVKQLTSFVSKMETKEVMVEFVVTQRAQLRKELMKLMEEQKEENQKKMDSLYNDQLAMEGEFGPNHLLHKTLKDYTFANLKQLQQ